ncbi:hypothetical protein Z946_3107 [Sulfitobacter noctilucicola]|uniref:Uncharacterized protein n=1 Tax=Sulfitobacter noctilucicola TaxID=1342301 RepID=A0A7W6Q5R2_9RHOB|nr:hypothetical protein [Sulfitobacter noctilucicola]KIN64218.1 hypothetical protein Z946_3107 [Sulfitobacter noctilucicola]MBB4175569.1 hypothetical protein [Sulfitobacter noctilucicola]
MNDAASDTPNGLIGRFQDILEQFDRLIGTEFGDTAPAPDEQQALDRLETKLAKLRALIDARSGDSQTQPAATSAPSASDVTAETPYKGGLAGFGEALASEISSLGDRVNAAFSSGTEEISTMLGAFENPTAEALQVAGVDANLGMFSSLTDQMSEVLFGAPNAADEAKAAFEDKVRNIEDAVALREEIADIKVKYNDLQAFAPDLSTRIGQLYTGAVAACDTGDLDRAKSCGADLAGEVAKAQQIKKGILERKQAFLDALDIVEVPSDAIDTEITAFEDLKKEASDALSVEAPQPDDFARAQAAFGRLILLIPQILIAVEIRKRIAEIINEREPLRAEIDRLLALPGDTTQGEKLQRKLSFEHEQIDALCAAKKVLEAQAMLIRLKATIPMLQAEEVEITKAKALREQIEREYAALTPKLIKAREFYAITPKFKSDVETFKTNDEGITTDINNNHFGKALASMDRTINAMERLLARQAEFDQALQARQTAKDALDAYKQIRTDVGAMKITLEDVRALYDEYAKENGDAYDAWDKNDYAAVLAPAGRAKTAGQKVLARKADCLAHEAQYDEVNTRYDAVVALTEPVRKRTDVATPALKQALKDFQVKWVETHGAFIKKPDMPKALILVAELEQIGANLVSLDLADKAAVQERDRVLALAAAAKPKLNHAKAVKPQTDAMYALFATFKSTAADFDAASNVADATCEAKLNAVIAAADAVIAEIPNNTGDLPQLKADCDARDAVVKPKFDAAMVEVRNYPTELHTKGAEISAKRTSYDGNYTSANYMVAKDLLDEIEPLAQGIMADVAAAQTATDARKAELDGKYDAAFVARLNAVIGYQDSSNDMKTKRADAVRVKADLENGKNQNYFKYALEKFDILDPLVGELETLKAADASLLADRAWLQTEMTGKQPDITTAEAIEGVNRETQAQVDAYNAAKKIFTTDYDSPDFPAARVYWPTYESEIDDTNAVQAVYDANRAAKDAADAAWPPISANWNTASDMRPLTPDIEILRDKFWAETALYDKSYYSHDYATALAKTPDLGRAAADLVAKKPDHDAADIAAETKADATATALDSITDADLRSKTADEKLQLLDDLRGQHKELDDEQRALQRRIYNAMELDPEFVRLDDKRREELKTAILNDGDLQAARSNWDSTDPSTEISDEEKVRLLTNLLKKECELYKMPVPEVKTYAEDTTTNGFFNPSDGTININIHPNSSFNDFFEAIDLMVHENAHNYQDYLVTRLDEGLLTPDDPEYDQALMFKSNDGPYAYVDGDEDYDTYKKQPMEEHAWKIGGGVRDALKAEPSM